MGHTLSLTDGTNTISLVASGVMLRHYVPLSPAIQHGGLIESVTEPVEVLISGASAAAVGAKAQAIEQMFLRARNRYWTGNGPRVFVQFQYSTEGAAYRSELINGSLELEKDALTAFPQFKVGARLLLTRQGFWEGPRTAIPLSNRNGANNTTGLTVYNKGTGQDNWGEIAASAVGGALPAPVELWLTNNTGGTRYYRNFRIANNTYNTLLNHILEGETSNPSVTVVSSSSASGGAYGAFTNISGTFQLEAGNSVTSKIAGRRVHILAKFAALPLINVWARVTVLDFAGVSPLYNGPEVRLDPPTATKFYHLGTIPLPPTAYDTSGPTLKIRIDVTCESSSTVGLDFIQLTPADDLCYRQLIQSGYGAPSGSVLVDNGIEGLVYLAVSGVNYPLYTARTQPLHVFPGVDQRIYVLHDGDNASVDWTLALRAWYRPRRITL